MISSNIDMEDGQVNEAGGILKLIIFKSNTTDPEKIWIDFGCPNVGINARLCMVEFMRSNNIDEGWTPI